MSNSNEHFWGFFHRTRSSITDIPAAKLGKLTGPDHKNSEAVNGNGAVVRLSMTVRNFIFTGDATGKTTKRILDNVSDAAKLKSRILMASHHGAETHETNSASWALATSPERVIFSAGLNSGLEHPRLQTVFNYLMLPSLEPGLDEHNVIFEQGLGPLAAGILAHLTPDYLTDPEIYTHGAGLAAHDWIKAKTRKGIYSTTCTPAGEKGISFNVALNGDIV